LAQVDCPVRAWLFGKLVDCSDCHNDGRS